MVSCLPDQIRGCREIQQLQTLQVSTIWRFFAVMQVTVVRDSGGNRLGCGSGDKYRCLLQQCLMPFATACVIDANSLIARYFAASLFLEGKKLIRFLLRSSAELPINFARDVSGFRHNCAYRVDSVEDARRSFR